MSTANARPRCLALATPECQQPQAGSGTGLPAWTRQLAPVDSSAWGSAVAPAIAPMASTKAAGNDDEIDVPTRSAS